MYSKATVTKPRAVEMWNGQEHTYREIFNHGFGTFLHPYLDYLHATTTMGIGCIDERVRPGEPRIAIAGSSVLENAGERAVMAYKLRKSGVTIPFVDFHHGCGARHIAVENIVTYGRKKHDEALQEARGRVRQLAASLNAQVENSPMLDCDFHVARGVVITGTPNFDIRPLHAKGFYPFLISGAYLQDASRIADRARLSWNIAQGAHGFGPNAFHKENPFLFLVAGDPRQILLDERRLGQAVQQMIRTLPVGERGNVYYDGTDIPSDTLHI